MSRLESITCPSCNVEFRREDVPPSHLCPVCGAHLFGSRAAGAESAGAAAADPDAPGPAPKPFTLPRAWDRPIKIGIGLLTAMILAASWYGHSIQNEGRERKQAMQAAENAAKTRHLERGQCVTEGGYFAAVTEDVLDRVTTYQRQGDRAAIKKLMDAGLVIPLAGGKTVYADTSWGTAKIRLPGEVAELWTYREAVTCK